MQVRLTSEEEALRIQINFNPAPGDNPVWEASGKASRALMKSLIARKAIPEVRMRFFCDPDFNVGGTKLSHLQIFERNGTQGDDIFSHPHFMAYLRYFLEGPRLPSNVIAAFQQRVSECGDVSSGDIIPLGEFARRQVRENKLDVGTAAEEFYKLALECDLSLSIARSIRGSVKKARRMA
jgi:hypothetical protein